MATVTLSTSTPDIPAPGNLKPPTAILAYVPLSVLWIVTLRLTDGIPFPLIPTLVGLAIDGALGYGMYRRRKAAWTVAVVLMILPILGIPNGFAQAGVDGGLLNLAFVIAVLYALFHPDTRAWCSEVRPPMGRPGSSAPHDHDRAAGEDFRRGTGLGS